MGQTKSHQYKPDLNKYVQDKSKKGLSYGLASMKGWRKYMEDSFLTIMNFDNDNKIELFAIFDGHGGCQVAIFVEEMFPEQLIKNQNFGKRKYKQALQETFIKMDELLLSQKGMKKLEQIVEEECYKNNSDNFFGDSKSGCTALVCLMTKQKIYVANAGDSKGIASVKRQCVSLNREHKPSLKQEEDRIIKAGGNIEYGRINGEINISRCLGDFRFKNNNQLDRKKQMIICDPQIIELQRQNIDYILLGCDGIWQRKNNQQMHIWITKALTQQDNKQNSQILSLLLDQQVSNSMHEDQGKDNMTAILITFQ